MSIPSWRLRAASGRFRDRVERAEQLALADGLEFAALSLDDQDAWYRLAKQDLARG